MENQRAKIALYEILYFDINPHGKPESKNRPLQNPLL
jgi:hypothetical protein